MSGGHSPEYVAYLASPAWSAFRQRYRTSGRRWRCAACGSESRLDLHHRTYARLGREHLADVVPVCRECHENIHVAARRTGRALDAVTDRYILRAQRRRGGKRVRLGDAAPQVIRRPRRLRLVGEAKKPKKPKKPFPPGLAAENDRLRALQDELRTRSAAAVAS